MHRRTLYAWCLVAGVLTVALAWMASSAAAAPPVQHYHAAFTCTATPNSQPDPSDCVGPFGPTEVDPVLCDIPGTLTDSQSGNVQLFSDGTQKVEFKERYTFTSALTGKSIQSWADTQQTFNTVPIDNGNGTISFVFAFKGVEQQLKLPDGSTLALDAGPITFTLTIDLATGDSSFSVAENGRHANLFSELCNVVVPALS